MRDPAHQVVSTERVDRHAAAESHRVMRRLVYLAVGVAGVALGIVVAALTQAFAGRAARLLLAFLPGVIGAVLWIGQGGSIGSALSWAIPVSGLLVVAAVLPEGSAVGWAISVVALLFLIAMLFVDSARRRWLDVVGRILRGRRSGRG